VPVATVSLPDGSTADIEYQEGATDDQILDFAFGEYQKSLETPSQNLFSDSLFRQGIVQEDVVEEEEEEELGFFEGVGDVLTNIATGATTGTKAITSGLVGVDNAISDSLNDTQEYLQSYLSAQAKADQQEMGRIQQEAEDKGVWDQVKAAGEAVSKAPLDITAQAAGTVVPQLGAAAVAFGVGSAVGTPLLGAAAAGLTNRAVAGVQGAGYIRESIYDAVYSEYKQADYPEEVAKQKALEAQELSGDNWYQILAGGVIGVVAGGSGLEKAILNKVLGDKAAQKLSQNALVRFGKGAITEAIPEGLQGAHEALAANTALQNENFDTPTFRGVPFQGAMEFAVGAPLGGFAGALNSPEQSSGDMFYDREEALTEQAIEKEAQLRAQEQKELEEENQKLFDALVANGVSEEEALAEIQEPVALLPPPESFDEREGIVTLASRTIKDPETARLDAQKRDKKERKFGATNPEKQRIKFAKEAAQQTDVPAGDSFTSIRGLDENGVPQYTGDVLNNKGEVVHSFDDPVVAAFAARELNNKVIQKTADFHVNSAIEQSEQDLNNAQKSVLRRIGRRLLNPNENTFSIDQVNYAANTTRESGFETEGLSAAEALDRGIPEDQMTASQKINAKRIKKGMPVLSSFSVKETKEALGDLFPRLVDLDVNYDGATYKAEIVDGKPVVVSDLGDVIKTRRTNPRQFGRRSPEASNRVNFASIAEAKQYADSLNYTAQQRGSVFVGDELFGANEIAPDDIRRLLKEKNISSEIGSPEVRFIASIATGDTRTRISDMSGVDLRLVYNKLRAMPNFKKPTKIPLYKPKSYSPAQYEFAANMLIENGALPDIELIKEQVSDITKADYKRLLKDLQKDVGVKSRLEGATAAKETTEAAEKEQQERQRTQEEEKSRVRAALNKVLKGYGLDRVKTNIVNFVSDAAQDADGNLVFGPEERGEVTEEGVDITEGEYNRALNQIFIALEGIKQTPEFTGDNLEQLAISVLNHEVLHAMRQLDLITQREYQLLENLAVNQIIPEGRDGAGMTFFQRANQLYGNDLSEIAVMEEAVAELVRAGLDGDLRIGGKPKALMKRIVEFIKGMFGVKEDLGYETFDDLIRGITGGQIGARADNEVRSLRVTEKRRAESVVRDPETGEEIEGAIKEPELPKIFRQVMGLSVSPQVEGDEPIQPIGKQAEADFLTDVELDSDPNRKQSRKRVGTTGQYVGAPKGVMSPQKLGSLLKTVEGLAREGEYGRFWYERSGRQILDLAGGDKKEAEKIIQAIAVTSPQTPVPANFQYAMQAYYQHKNGEPIRTGMFTTAVSKKLEDIFAGKPWEGRKTNEFYKNLMREIDPSIVQGVTNDLWMMRAFQQFSDAPTDAQYNFVERETKKIADKLGWEPQQVQAAVWVALKSRMESKEVKKKTDNISERKGFIRFDKDKQGRRVRVILKPEDHRINWFRQAMKHTPSLKEKALSKFDYKDASESSLAQISWESKPSRVSGHMKQIFDAPYEQQLEYHEQISKAFLDNDGNDIIAKEFGILSPGNFEAPGFYEGTVSPGTQTKVVLPRKYKGEDFGEVEEAALDLAESYAVTLGTLLKQDSVGYHRPFFVSGLSKANSNGVEVSIGRPLTDQENKKMADLFIEETNSEDAAPISTSDGARFINFTNEDGESFLGVDNKQFHDIVYRTISRMKFDNGEVGKAKLFASLNGYLGNNWETDKNGEGYLVNSRLSRRSDLQQRVRSVIEQLEPRINAVEEEFYSKYGWEPDRSLNAQYRQERELPQAEIAEDVEVAEETFVEPKERKLRDHNPAEVEKAVEANAKQAIDSKGIAVPTYSLNASPEAQYVARNPEAGSSNPTRMKSLKRRPPATKEEKDLLERLTGEAPAPRSQFDVYNESVNNISSNSDTSKFKFFSDQFRQQFIDRFSRIGRITRENKDVLSQLASSSSYKALLNADRSMGLVEGAIKDGQLVYMDGIGQIDRSKKSLIETLAPLQNTKYGNIEREFKAYAVAMRGYNLNLKGIKTPVSEGDKEKAIAMARKYTDENGQSIIENVYKDWQNYNRSTVKFLQDTGVIDDEAAQTWLENADYYPFYTEVAVGGSSVINKEIAQNVFSGMTRAATFTKLEGSENSINLDSSVAISRNLMAAVQMGLNNVAQQRVARDMMKIGLAEEVSTKGNLQDSAVEIRVNGKKRRFLIKDPLVYESLTAMDGIEGGFWYKLINLPSQVLRETVTRSPDFVLANLMRDSLSSYITTGAGRKVFPLYSTFKEFAAGDIEELQRFGLVQGYDLSRQASDIGKFFAKESAKREQGIMSQLKNPFKATWDVLGGMTTKSDAATRLAVYKDVLARTGDHAEAAFQAMEVLNFGRRGRNLTFRYFAAAVPFLNARIQGLDVLYRAMMGYQSADLSKSRGQIAATALTRTGILTGITFLYWLAMHDEDEYKAEDDVVRELNFLIKTPFGFTMKMPTAFEVGFITKIIPEAIFNANAKAINEALGRDTDGKMADYTDKQMFDTLVRGFGTATQLSPFDIQITGPFLEAAANYNSFTKRPIVPPYIMEGSGGGARFPSEQYTPYTSETGKVIGKLTDTSPMIVDHLIRGYTGTIGTYLSAAVDGIVRNVSDPKGAAPTVPITEMPLMRRFFAREAPGGLKSEVYELSNELSMTIGALEDMQEAGRSEEAKAFIAERRTLFDKEKDIKNLRKRVDKARKEIKEIVASDLDREEKRKRKQEIENYINEYLMGAVPEIYASVKTPITRVGGI
jgi:hypothetical protein